MSSNFSWMSDWGDALLQIKKDREARAKEREQRRINEETLTKVEADVEKMINYNPTPVADPEKLKEIDRLEEIANLYSNNTPMYKPGGEEKDDIWYKARTEQNRIIQNYPEEIQRLRDKEIQRLRDKANQEGEIPKPTNPMTLAAKYAGQYSKMDASGRQAFNMLMEGAGNIHKTNQQKYNEIIDKRNKAKKLQADKEFVNSHSNLYTTDSLTEFGHSGDMGRLKFKETMSQKAFWDIFSEEHTSESVNKAWKAYDSGDTNYYGLLVKDPTKAKGYKSPTNVKQSKSISGMTDDEIINLLKAENEKRKKTGAKLIIISPESIQQFRKQNK